jgi:hypothetical protein
MSKSLLARYNAQLGGLCRQCGGKMEVGQALENVLSGYPDFPGDNHAVTVSPSGRAKLVSCIKCVECGWSVTGGGK